VFVGLLIASYIDEKKLKKIEKKYKLSIPEPYRQFLLLYEDGAPDQDIQYPAIESIPRAGKDNLLSFGAFLVAVDGSDSLEDHLKDYYERIPASILPIATDYTGNLICIGVSGAAAGKIYYWDHENELAAKIMLQMDLKGITSIDDYWENIYLVAESFIDFIRSLQIEEVTETRSVSSIIVKESMRDGFIESMKFAREKLEAEEKEKKAKRKNK
jgi:hypothetical protein